MMETPEQFGIKDSERTRCEIWTRVMGYHRPISSFNIGKQGEAAERKYFSEKSAEMNSIVSCNGKTPPSDASSPDGFICMKNKSKQ